MESNEHRGDKYQASRSRRTQGRDARPEGHRAGRSAARDDRVPDDSFPLRAQSSRSRSPTKRSRSPDKLHGIPRSSTADSTLATRRNHDTSRPFEIDVNSARQYHSVSKKAVQIQTQPQHQSHQADVVSPATPPLRRTQERHTGDPDEVETSSYYSEDDYGQAHPSYISPLRFRKVARDGNTAPGSHHDRGTSPSPDPRAQNASPEARSPQRRALRRTATTIDLGDDEPPRTPRNYSPLSDYLSSQVMPVRKEMVGAKGWLERTTKPADNTTATGKNDDRKDAPAQKKPGFLHNLRKIAKDVTSSAKDMTSSASRKSRDKEHKVSRLTVSLDPREQSLLYCELEFLLTTALDGYINSQFNAGRLDADKYKRVVDGWQQRGRPKVVGFRYDLETQLDLVMLHSEDFRFYGKRAGLLAAVNGVLDMMRVDARAMRIRTFCQPDTVVAKQLLDAQSLFNLIGCCEQQQIQLAEIIQFFKVILEREQNYRQMEAAAQPDQQGEQQWHSSSAGTENGFHPNKKPQSSKDTTSPLDYVSF